MPAPRRPATADFHTRRKLVLALAAAPLAVAIPTLSAIPAMSVGEVIAWLHLVGFRTSHEQQVASRHD